MHDIFMEMRYNLRSKILKRMSFHAITVYVYSTFIASSELSVKATVEDRIS